MVAAARCSDHAASLAARVAHHDRAILRRKTAPITAPDTALATVQDLAGIRPRVRDPDKTRTATVSEIRGLNSYPSRSQKIFKAWLRSDATVSVIPPAPDRPT